MVADRNTPHHIGWCDNAKKVKFESRRMARRFRQMHPDSTPQNAYTCQHCRCWHLGHLPAKVRQSKRDRGWIRKPA